MFAKWIYLVILVGFNMIQKFLRLPFEKQFKQRQKNDIKVDQYDVLEKLLLYGLSIGLLFLPLLWTVTEWFAFADRVHSWGLFLTGWIVMLLSLALFWKTHQDLAENWSPTLMVMKEHHLITTGIYRKLRHPMYSAEVLFCFAQLLITPNWFVGGSAMFFFIVLMFVRIPREEAMMIEEFGQEYLQYREVTGSLIPKIK